MVTSLKVVVVLHDLMWLASPTHASLFNLLICKMESQTPKTNNKTLDLCLICFHLDSFPVWPFLGSILLLPLALQAWDSCLVSPNHQSLAFFSWAGLFDYQGTHLAPGVLPTLTSDLQDPNSSSPSGSHWGLVLASHSGGNIRQMDSPSHFTGHTLVISDAN